MKGAGVLGFELHPEVDDPGVAGAEVARLHPPALGSHHAPGAVPQVEGDDVRIIPGQGRSHGQIPIIGSVLGHVQAGPPQEPHRRPRHAWLSEGSLERVCSLCAR